MAEKTNPTDHLLDKLEILQKKQDVVAREIYQLRKEIYRMKAEDSQQKISEQIVSEEDDSEAIKNQSDEEGQYVAREQKTEEPRIWRPTSSQDDDSSGNGFSLEKFVGENLINKIGIAITVIGVSIGVKYSIDHNLISPATRVLLGYLAGAVLLVLGIRLKKEYGNYSAVLVSGSMAIFYFMTYAAYSFYGLIPQFVAFALMVAITAFTVLAAWQYDRQVIAIIGMAGAYAVPFLLGDENGKAVTLFGYIAIINIGILVVSLKKYWEPLYFCSFVLTWLIYLSWYILKRQPFTEIKMAFAFLAIFFVLFYITFLAYKVSRKQKFDTTDILLLLANSFIFFGIGYSITVSLPYGKDWLGLFTLVNALIHAGVCLLIFLKKLADKNLFHFVQGLVIVFVTIAIPVQLEGNWITLFWALEAVLLFWVGRTRNGLPYEILSYPLMVLTLLSLLHDWSVGYYHIGATDALTQMTPLWNIFFLTTVLVVISFGIIHLINSNPKYTSPLTNQSDSQDDFLRMMTFVIQFLLLFTLYFSFRNEIAAYWDQRFADSAIHLNEQGKDLISNGDLPKMKTVWLVNYTLFFFSLLSLVNIKRLKSKHLGMINLVVNVLVIVFFLASVLFLLGDLRESYLSKDTIQHYQHGVFNIWIRYISLIFLAGCLYSCYAYVRQEFMQNEYRIHFDFLLYSSILWVASSELIHWMNMAGSTQSYKLGLSILWGVYSLLLISLGIWKKKKYLRVGAIALFGVTLIKLFFYDLIDMDTISKTIVFVSLGTLLLIISFIYNKFKDIISD
ncbi:MAG: DUF2339 domain-containing protein [Prolixibacteraceae bacterium]